MAHGAAGPRQCQRGAAGQRLGDATAPYRAHTYDGKQELPEARAATADDIGRILGDYAAAARNAIAAGFDGVQIHGANGYLVDQFLRDGTNLRDDDYGGPVANRLRFMREVVEAVASEAGIGRTGIRLSPNGESRAPTTATMRRCSPPPPPSSRRLGVPWIELREPGPHSTFRAADEPRGQPGDAQGLSGRIVLNSDYVGASAEAKLAEGVADAISFGRPFIANPDLVDRIRGGAALDRGRRGDLLQPRARRLHRLSRTAGTGSRLTGSSPEQ